MENNELQNLYETDLEKRITEECGENNLSKGPHANEIDGWWFSDEEILKANENEAMLTLDIDAGKICDLDCTYCFANTRNKDNKQYVIKTTERLKGLLKEAADLGCKSIKIVGAGEPLLFKGLLEIVREANSLGLKTIIFTAGHILGDDERASRIFAHEGVELGLDLAKKLADLNCSFIVKFMSLDPEKQAKLCGKTNEYIQKRDTGLLNLLKLGLNKQTPTRLGVDCLLLKSNIDEALNLFRFFNRFNIFCVLNTTMDCGKTAQKEVNPEVVGQEEALKAAISLYRYMIENNIPFDKRTSPYFCSPACSQLNHGLFVGDDGVVKACPGGPEIANYAEGGLAEIWRNNEFRKKFKCVLGHKCISRCGITYPEDLKQRIQEDLRFES